MTELTESEIAKRDDLWSRRNDIVSEIEQTMNALADAIEMAREHCEGLVEQYNQNLADMVSFAEEIAEGARNMDADDDFVDAWDNWCPDDLNLDDLELPDTGDLREELVLNDDINDLPTED